MTRQEAILKVAEKEYGEKDSIVSVIGKELYKQFCLMGFIREGVTILDNKKVNTWSITERGISNAEFYRKPTPEEEEMGKYYHSIGI